MDAGAAIVEAGGIGGADPREELKRVGIGEYGLVEGFLILLHRVERNALPRLGENVDLRRVFLGKEALGDRPEFPGCAGEDHAPEEHHDHAMAHRPTKRVAVVPERPLEHVLQTAIHPPVLAGMPRTQVAAAEHRGEGQRNKARNQHRGSNDHGKFVEQPPDNSAHEENRQEDRRQRQGHRDNREADFPRAIERRLPHALALLHVAHDIFEHDDGVIDDKADRERQREQG